MRPLNERRGSFLSKPCCVIDTRLLFDALRLRNRTHYLIHPSDGSPDGIFSARFTFSLFHLSAICLAVRPSCDHLHQVKSRSKISSPSLLVDVVSTPDIFHKYSYLFPHTFYTETLRRKTFGKEVQGLSRV